MLDRFRIKVNGKKRQNNTRADKASNSKSEHGGGLDAEVLLNVYDIRPDMNYYTFWIGLGLFHTGIEEETQLSLCQPQPMSQ
ncbi:hypothetical protein NMG60_11031916 [Bertholletia excelsa]